MARRLTEADVSRDDGAEHFLLEELPHVGGHLLAKVGALIEHRQQHALDVEIRAAYDAFDFKRITAALGNFMTVELSAYYFDIRKDALYCDPISSG